MTNTPNPFDPITKPEHYNTRGGIEPKEFIISNNMDWVEGNIVKYLYRYPHKGTAIKDIEKLIEFAQMLLEREKNK